MDEEELKNEKEIFLIMRHTAFDSTGDPDFDFNRMFELNLAHDLATSQKKTLDFIEPEDDIDDLMYKHYTMLKRIDFNFGKFNEQLEDEVAHEEDFEHNTMTSQSVVETHDELEHLYSTAEDMRGQLNLLLGEARSTMKQITDRVPAKTAAPKRTDGGQGSFDSAQVKI